MWYAKLDKFALICKFIGLSPAAKDNGFPVKITKKY